ncbi:sugar-binding transcriptional regulator [Rouxiella badensis]|uniref:sugar-binding transcriptional regulator n=1 Tax=Rouxiella badensis TaxID=1646377 RepID=UPI0013EF01DD|nr:sugar-binding transcriptional regulator [Rouxiella badensis]QII38367.1 sugar-binding transcriptional regulator [Rouxiella badensis]
MNKNDKKLDQAARAAWMYYVAGQTQHEIAEALGISRQVAQRLVASAIESGLVSVHISHSVGNCMALEARLREAYGLSLCQVVPAQGMSKTGLLHAIAVAGAQVMTQFIRREASTIIGVGSGRTLKAAIDELDDIERPQHSCVSLIGAIAYDGSCTRYDVPMLMAEKTQGRYFILPAPLFADSEQDREGWCHHRIYRTVSEKASQADVTFTGIGTIGPDCPLHLDGFLSLEQVEKLKAAGAVGEMVGHFIGADGQRIDSELNARLTSVSLQPKADKPVIAMAGGAEKHLAMRAALQGGWVSGLVTDELSAIAMLE